MGQRDFAGLKSRSFLGLSLCFSSKYSEHRNDIFEVSFSKHQQAVSSYFEGPCCKHLKRKPVMSSVYWEAVVCYAMLSSLRILSIMDHSCLINVKNNALRVYTTCQKPAYQDRVDYVSKFRSFSIQFQQKLTRIKEEFKWLGFIGDEPL